MSPFLVGGVLLALTLVVAGCNLDFSPAPLGETLCSDGCEVPVDTTGDAIQMDMPSDQSSDFGLDTDVQPDAEVDLPPVVECTLQSDCGLHERCSPDQVCVDIGCSEGCPAQTFCDQNTGACRENCDGACELDEFCETDLQVCIPQCEPACGANQACTISGCACIEGFLACGETGCQDYSRDVENCGGCGVSCACTQDDPKAVVITPQRNAIGIAPDASILIQGTCAFSADDINELSVAVYGDLTGRYRVSIVWVDARTIRLEHALPFLPNEVVSVYFGKAALFDGQSTNNYSSQSQFRVRAGAGGGFLDTNTMEIPGPWSYEIVAADLDRDRDIDLWVTHWGTAPHQLLRNEEGTFVQDGLFNAGAAIGAVATDIYGDYSLDIYTASPGLNQLLVRDQEGVFVTIPDGNEEIRDTRRVTSFDINGGVLPDVLDSNHQATDSTWHSIAEDIVNHNPLQGASGDDKHIAVGDIDADGNIDYVLSRWTIEDAAVFREQSVDTGELVSFGTASTSIMTCLMDVNADHRLEVVQVSEFLNMEGNGLELFSLTTADAGRDQFESLHTEIFDGHTGCAVGDLDGDNVAELVTARVETTVTGIETTAVDIYKVKAGKLDRTTTLRSSISRPETVSLVDVNGDQALDILVTLGAPAEQRLTPSGIVFLALP